MRASLYSLAVLVALIVQPPTADAATITTTVGFTATNFTSVQGTTPPVDPVTGSFTLTFDQSQFAFDATSIVVNDLNIDLGSPISFSYNPDIAALTIGGSALGSGAFFWGTDDFSLGLVLLSGTTYKPQSFVYSQAGINDAFTASFSPVIPIPASAYLLVTALSALGLLGFRRARLLSHGQIRVCPLLSPLREQMANRSGELRLVARDPRNGHCSPRRMAAIR